MQDTRRTGSARAWLFFVLAFFVAAVVAGALLRAGSGKSASRTMSSSEGPDPALFRTARDFEIEGLSEADLTERQRSFQFRDEQWGREAAFVPIASGAEVLVSRWRESLLDPSGLIPPGKGDDLLRKIAGHAMVRADRTPEAYLRLVEADPSLEWNELGVEEIDGLRRDSQVGVFFKYFLEEDFDATANRRETLRRVWDGLARFDHLFSEVGVGDKGAAILVVKLRVPAELQTGGLSGKHSLSVDYWRAVGTRAGMQFSRARRNTPEAMADHAGIAVAFSNILVRMADGRIINWITRWYLDPESHRWILDAMDASSSREAFVVS